MYLDTAVLVKLLVPEPDSPHYARIADGQLDVWSSQVALAEVFSALLRKEREAAIRNPQRVAAWRQIQLYLEAGSLRLVPLTETLLARANDVMESCHPEVPLRTLDAIHLASCVESRSGPLVTNDRVMRAAAVRLQLDLAPLP